MSRNIRKGWHLANEDGALILARRWPARFDLAVETLLPKVRHKARLAHHVRQDLWRALQGLRGFTPCIRVEESADATRLIAGGQLDAGGARNAALARIEALLEDPDRRARWTRWS
ncbi:hypothetical protein Q4543_14885 [Salipiger sp. 1_MG-2023]|uniref:hypothetical protein n=1 Tax=Salipiger sp. 1_MG-2023 TaxID=3062665 RepID=UPI0026E11FB5|nr:hypothetical protein [Salipiger sp. 1_MG-2023]MDO6586797.1 hypothetical protein [Salipiger sp. 1_MG-2023]